MLLTAVGSESSKLPRGVWPLDRFENHALKRSFEAVLFNPCCMDYHASSWIWLLFFKYDMTAIITPCVCSFVSNSLPTPWTVACQTPLSVELSRQEYWSKLPFPTPGYLPYLRIEPASIAPSALAGVLFTREAPITLCRPIMSESLRSGFQSLKLFFNVFF